MIKMKEKSELYLKNFIYAFILNEASIIGGMVFLLLTDNKNNVIYVASFLIIFLRIFNCLILFLIYIRDPSPKDIIDKETFGIIGRKHGKMLLIFTLVSAFAYPTSATIVSIIPDFFMPVPYFYGHLVVIIAILWFIIYHKDTLHIFDVIVVYIKDELYPNTWPAEVRGSDRRYHLENSYKQWLIMYGSNEEKIYNKSLSIQSEEEARRFAASRMQQIRNEYNHP